MKILVTGCKGYIGTVLMPLLKEKNLDASGIDSCFFDECNLSKIKEDYKFKKIDIRDLTIENLKNIDGVIHLAGLSNDPLGELNPSLTYDINYKATVRLAKLAKEANVKRFVYASSQSMYGISNTKDELEEDNSEKNPITSYAKTKWDSECEIKKLSDQNFTVVCFRPSTVFGVSPRLRCDIVFNNLVACAYTTGIIEIKSDGTPWRPVIHVKDVSQAFIAGLLAPKEIVNCRSYNIGLPNGNFTVRQLAEAASKAVPNSKLIFTGEHGKDSRSYKVCFDRILNELSDWYKPKWTLEKGGIELVNYFKEIKFNESDFRGKKTNRLSQLQYLENQNKLNQELKWK